MSWAETLRTALAAVRANRTRSVLTMLGIVIGIASVILTVGLGQGAQNQVREQIDALGSNLLIVSPGSSTDDSGVRGGCGAAATLTRADAEAIADPEVVPDVAAVAPVTSTSASLTADGTNWTTRLVGATDAWPSVRSRELASGRWFTDAEAERGAKVVVLASDTADELFDRGNPVGQTVRALGNELTVIGVLEASGASTSASESDDDQALVPVRTADELTGSTGGSASTIYVQAASADRLGAAYSEVQNLLVNRHGVTTDEADFSVATQESLVATANETNRTMSVLLAGVAAISLLVGGIGVMNIMLVSVSERVKEIGLRKALGATPSSIRRQFLLEASLLGLLGGVVGLLIGVVGALVLPHLIDQQVTVSALAAGGALVTSLALGIGFGVHPADRAARMTPIDALRSD